MVENYPHLIGKQVLLWGYENDLPGYMGCVIYISIRNDSAEELTIAWAMQHGLALASPLGADAAMFYAGEELVVQDEQVLASYVINMAQCPDLLSHNQAVMLRKASEWNIERYLDALIKGMDEVAGEFGVKNT